MLEHNYRISFQVRHVNSLPLLFHHRMFPHQQPSNVREKEASVYIVRVRICVRIFVMQAMIPTPSVQRVLRK